jgi:hypothetical protein
MINLPQLRATAVWGDRKCLHIKALPTGVLPIAAAGEILSRNSRLARPKGSANFSTMMTRPSRDFSPQLWTAMRAIEVERWRVCASMTAQEQKDSETAFLGSSALQSRHRARMSTY